MSMNMYNCGVLTEKVHCPSFCLVFANVGNLSLLSLR